MDDIKNQFLKRLYKTLQEMGPCNEYDLLNSLQKQGHNYFSDLNFGDTLKLFQAHYLLFHLLYLLQEKLLNEKKAFLKIHCLNISLGSYTEDAANLNKFDYIKGYYSDNEKAERFSQEEVDTMINDFWKKMANFQNEEALKILDLNQGASNEVIKERFKELALIHHPDRGGNKEDFQRILDAKNELIS